MWHNIFPCYENNFMKKDDENIKRGKHDVRSEQVAQNPNPRANENIHERTDEPGTENADMEDEVGTEITDGEDG